MIDITASLDIIYNKSLTFFSQSVINYLNSRFNNELPNTLTSELTHFVCQPIWSRYRRSNINFDNDEEGITDFTTNLYEVIADSFNHFLTSTKANIEYLVYYVDATKPNTPFEKQIISSIMPINQKVDQKLAESKLASGTTGQQLSEITKVGIAWRKALEQFYTPIYQQEFLNNFRWLFKMVFTEYYDYREEVKDGHNVYIAPGLIDYNGHDDLQFEWYYRFDERALWTPIDSSMDGYIKLPKVSEIQLRCICVSDTFYNVDFGFGGDYTLLLISSDLINEDVYSDMVTIDRDIYVEIYGYTED